MIGGRKVLVVEDDARNLIALSTLLRGFKINFKRNTNGVGVFEQTLLFRPDAVLLDIDLPDSDAFKICRGIRSDARTAAIPVVALTGPLCAGLVKHLQESGFTTYLVMPTRGHDLKKVLQSIWAPNAADDSASADHQGYV